jgi:hypothetical protein
MKYKTNEMAKQLFPLIDASKHYIITGKRRQSLSDIENKKLREALYEVQNLVGGAIRATLQIHSIYESTIVCHKMVQSYPWKRNRITKSQHLYFVWSQFTNLCYLFEERLKLLIDLQNRTLGMFQKQKSLKISDWIKKIRKSLGAHIRERGQNTHEWSKSNPHAEYFATIEFINSIEPQSEGLLGNLIGQYRVTRMLMRWEIEAAIKFMEVFLLDLFAKQVPELVSCALIFNELVERSRDGTVTVKGTQITMTRPNAP